MKFPGPVRQDQQVSSPQSSANLTPSTQAGSPGACGGLVSFNAAFMTNTYASVLSPKYGAVPPEPVGPIDVAGCE